MLTIHGNGFIQVPLSDAVRMHVWHPECPRQKIDTSVHDHRFSFTSTVIRGALENIRYCQVEPYPGVKQSWKVYTPGDVTAGQEPYSLYDTGHRVLCSKHPPYLVVAGETYSMDSQVFHRTVPRSEFVVTVMVKTRVLYQFPSRVLVPEGVEPDNDFSREDDQAFLWTLVREALSS